MAGPLAGVRAVVTRAREWSGELRDGLLGLGAEVLEAPVIAVVPPVDQVALDEAARRVAGYDWVVLTSATGVKFFGAALERVGGTPDLAGVRVASIGPATASALAGLGIEPALIAEEAVAESLLEGLLHELAPGGSGRSGGKVLLPVAAGARDVLERGLAAAGIEVERVTAYRTVGDPEGVARLVTALRAGWVDLLTLASPSAVERVAGALGSELEERLRGVVVAVIGPITGAAAERCGMEVRVEASEHTVAGLLGALVEYYGC